MTIEGQYVQVGIVETVSGTVEKVHNRGMILSGRPGWLNVSRFAADAQMPATGDNVTIGLDRQGYVREIQVKGARVAGPPTSGGAASPDSKPYITRMAAIGHALKYWELVEAGSEESGPGISLEDVLAVAQKFADFADDIPF